VVGALVAVLTGVFALLDPPGLDALEDAFIDRVARKFGEARECFDHGAEVRETNGVGIDVGMVLVEKLRNDIDIEPAERSAHE